MTGSRGSDPPVLPESTEGLTIQWQYWELVGTGTGCLVGGSSSLGAPRPLAAPGERGKLPIVMGDCSSERLREGANLLLKSITA